MAPNSKYNGIGKWIGASVIAATLAGYGVWVGAIDQKVKNKVDKVEFVALKKDMEYLKKEAEKAAESREKILKAIEKAHQ